MTSTPASDPIDAIGLSGILHQPVRSVRFEEIDDSRGRMSEVSRGRVDYDTDREGEGESASADDRPSSVIVKRTVAEDLGHELRMAEREHGVFTDFSRVTDAVSVRCFASRLSQDGDEGVLVLEDVSGPALPTQHEGADDAAALAIVEVLARAHAATWNLPRAEVASWCPAADSEILLRQVELAQRLWPQFAEWHAGYLPERGMGLAEGLLRELPTLLEAWAQGSPRCILHGDVRLDNVLPTRSAGYASSTGSWPGTDRPRPISPTSSGTASMSPHSAGRGRGCSTPMRPRSPPTGCPSMPGRTCTRMSGGRSRSCCRSTCASAPRPTPPIFRAVRLTRYIAAIADHAPAV